MFGNSPAYVRGLQKYVRNLQDIGDTGCSLQLGEAFQNLCEAFAGFE
jgi:hypothetical protein